MQLIVTIGVVLSGRVPRELRPGRNSCDTEKVNDKERGAAPQQPTYAATVAETDTQEVACSISVPAESQLGLWAHFIVFQQTKGQKEPIKTMLDNKPFTLQFRTLLLLLYFRLFKPFSFFAILFNLPLFVIW